MLRSPSALFTQYIFFSEKITSSYHHSSPLYFLYYFTYHGIHLRRPLPVSILLLVQVLRSSITKKQKRASQHEESRGIQTCYYSLIEVGVFILPAFSLSKQRVFVLRSILFWEDDDCGSSQRKGELHGTISLFRSSPRSMHAFLFFSLRS